MTSRGRILIGAGVCLGLIHVLGVATALVNDPPIPCKNTTDCRTTSLPGNASCENGQCVCPDERNVTKLCSSLLAGAINHTKPPHPVVGRFCKVNHDCYLDHGICNTTNSQCACVKGYVLSSDKYSCVEESSLGNSCTDKAQCANKVANSTCEDGKCVCVAGYHQADNRCWEDVAFGKPCTETRQCSHVAGGVCTERKLCGCETGRRISVDGKRCLPTIGKIGEECSEDAQCDAIVGAKCLDSTCRCGKQEHFVDSAKECVANRVLGDPCNSSDECYQGEKEGETKALQCFEKICACADGYNKDGNVCTKGGASAAKSSMLVALLAIILRGLFA